MAENTMKNKHMGLEMRISIQLGIPENTLLRDIVKDIGKNTTMVSKEIQKHRYSKIVVREGVFLTPDDVEAFVENIGKVKVEDIRNDENNGGGVHQKWNFGL